ncbi:hypothetical protein EZV62_010601 [Acer yangbiense]|uniref:Uncharacterized protein n=1 Tax=Acer yangbiense TaxID=1000413 RepID=A0A5C7I2T2_9ROSI|nr:hypothetical protein EZV62_010601 [Acer yangbiense]
MCLVFLILFLYNFQIGGGYLFRLPVGFIADSIGATLGATAAFLIGRTPSTFALVYVGTTVKDLSDVTHGWDEISTTHLVLMALGFATSVVLIVCIAKVAKASLDKALVENTDRGILVATPTMLPIVVESALHLQNPLITKIDSIREDHENQLLV